MTAVIRTIPRFARLPSDVLEEIANVGRFRRVDKGVVLFWEGDESREMHYIVSGTVKITKHLNNGREVVLDVLGPGETVDEWAVLSGLPHFITAVAHEASDVFVLSREQYVGLLGRFPERIGEQMRELSIQVSHLMRRLSELAAGSVQARLAFLLFTLNQKFGSPRGGGTFTIDLPLSRQEIADMVGTTVETAIRTMSRFQKRRILMSTESGLTILKPECLSNIAENNCDCVHNPCNATKAAAVLEAN